MPLDESGMVKVAFPRSALAEDKVTGDVADSCVKHPRHVAIIMDGNGRWARERSLPRSAGHRQGVKAVRRAIRAALDLGIEYLTIYSFSVENWSRPAEEVSDLLGLLKRFVRQDLAELDAAGIKVLIIGERSDLAPDLAALLEESERLTASNTRMTLAVAFNYGSRQEIASAVRRLSEEVERGRLAVSDITPAAITKALYAGEIPDPDLVIRTSGEQRLSNFLLWQSAYAEFAFPSVLWPDFDEAAFEMALADYHGRTRRFGMVTDARTVRAL